MRPPIHPVPRPVWTVSAGLSRAFEAAGGIPRPNRRRGDARAGRTDAPSSLAGDGGRQGSSSSTDDGPDGSSSLPVVGSLIGVALVAVLSRSYVYGSVFRKGDVVLLGNDPYGTRYWVERFVEESGGVLDIGVLSSFTTRDYLFVATMGRTAELLGGDPAAVGVVLAWYPVVAALVTIGLVYGAARRLTDNHWIAAVAGLMLAITPVTVIRTALGFADHHAFDYVWLSLTLFCLVRLADADREWPSRETPLLGGLLGVAVAGQLLSWLGGPLLVFPLGLYVGLAVISAVRADRSPIRWYAPVGLGLLLAAILTWSAHAALGWHPLLIAITPALLFGAATAIVVVAEIVHRSGGSPIFVAVAELALAGIATAAVVARTEAPTASVSDGIAFFTETSTTAAEAAPLIEGPFGVVTGPLSLFGGFLFLALPYLVVASLAAYREHRPAWLAIVAYAWFLLALALVQRRFSGELSIVLVAIAAVGLFDVAARIGVIRAIPTFGTDRGAGGRVSLNEERANVGVYPLAAVVLVLVVASFVQIPIKMNQNVVDGETHDAALWLREYADDRGMSYPENYVFSAWGRNRAYNYFVNGESRVYWYAEGHYNDFLLSRDGAAWYRRLRERPVGFIVTTEIPSALPDDSLHVRLHDRLGTRADGVSGLGHYRALYASHDGTIKTFELVHGARFVGTAGRNESVTLSTDVEIDGARFTYRRAVKPNPYGLYAITVPYPGGYTVGGTRHEVAEAAVIDGRLIKLHDRDGVAHWPLDEGGGRTAFDRVGGNRGTIHGATWSTDAARGGHALSFDGDDYVEVPHSPVLDLSDGFTLSALVRTDEEVDYVNDVTHVDLVSKADTGSRIETRGARLMMRSGRITGVVGNGSDATFVDGTYFEAGRWHRATLTWDGSTIRLYLDGELIASGRFAADPANDHPLLIGSTAPGYGRFRGRLDEVRVFDRALSPEEVRTTYDEA